MVRVFQPTLTLTIATYKLSGEKRERGRERGAKFKGRSRLRNVRLWDEFSLTPSLGVNTEV